ncbi:DUF87 domain-containing protein [Sphaerisporangium sp. NBC_01403]|uniref:ATP-binding protein n=1 Tax=Sphaerisporangium sp. NBC_01403 TaxID=2903599 RepID=UPI0032432A93
MMTGEERRALEALRFNYVEGPGDVWRPSQFHVDGLHRRTTQAILDGLAEANYSVEASPIGVILQGQRGTGKTHLLGWVRQKVQEDGGYFFLVGLFDARDFWESVIVSVLDSLAREIDGESQLRMFLRRLSSLVGVQPMARQQLIGKAPLSKPALDALVEGLRRFDARVGGDAQDTLRALVLRASDDLRAQDIGSTFMSSQPEEEPGERAQWGMRRGHKSPQEIVRDISRLLAFTGPSVIAVDQIDPLIAQASITSKQNVEQDWRQMLVIEQIAGGLMSLREHTHRTLTVVSCLPLSWVLIEKAATDTVRDRFRQAVPLMTIPDSKIGLNLVEKRFAARFRKVGFRPPYPTWPVKASAFEHAPDFTPRQLLIKIDGHVQACLAADQVKELENLADPIEVMPVVDVPGRVPTPVLAGIDTRFAELRELGNAAAALDFPTEDAVMPGLLSAGLVAWIAEQGEPGQVFSQDAPPSAKPPLHARLRRTLNETTQDEVHWCFRSIAVDNPRAALNRLRAACVAAGLDAEVSKRRLFVLRNREWSGGSRTQEAIAEFEKAGGRTLCVEEEDLKTLAALRDLLTENPPNLQAWLAERKPASGIKLFKEALGDVWSAPLEYVRGVADHSRPMTTTPDEERTRSTVAGNGTVGSRTTDELPSNVWSVPVRGNGDAVVPAPPPLAKKAVEGQAPSIPIGMTIAGDRPVSVELEALRKHTAIFAGSGSGKTVLIRHLVEECALQGVSAIVLDPNNDLARLGDPWPEEPWQWAAGDAARAEEYLANTDVVVWTPRRDGGRPLSFQPLPDFSSVVGDADEFAEAVESAVASIAPRVKLVGNAPKAHQGLAVLREAVTYYGRQGATSLRGLIALMSSLPEGISELRNAEKLAAEIAENLTAAMVNDPLFGGAGVAMDPGVLLTPPEGKRARVSVISLVGLQSDDQRQSFVNQLQMALFAWIKKHPAGERPLGGLFVMDEAQTFAPSGAMTACTQSTLALTSQARKYGLGLVFATQAPKGLHNRIPGNAATQFFGLLNSSIQMTAARELARAKGSDVDDIARLTSGQFYTAVEGAGFEKLRTPLCLSHHPKSPLTTEEVIGRARRSMGTSPG